MTKALELTPEVEQMIKTEVIGHFEPKVVYDYVEPGSPIVPPQPHPYIQHEAFQREKETQIKKNRQQWIDALRVYKDKQYFGGWWGYDETNKETFCAQGLVLMLLGIDRNSVLPRTEEAHHKGCNWLGVTPTAWTKIASDNDNKLTFETIADNAERGMYWQL